MTDTTTELPKPVRRLYDEATSALADVAKPVASQLDERTWLVYIDTGRVYATAPVRKGFDGAWKVKNGLLRIDGSSEPPVKRWGDLAKLIHDHPGSEE